MLVKIEATLVTIGIVCLLVFGIHRCSQTLAADRLMSEFSERHAASKVNVADARMQPLPLASEAPQQALHFDKNSVDQADWSITRKRAFSSQSTVDSEMMGILSIPVLNLRAPILAGIDEEALDTGVGWLDRTAAPGHQGNAAIAGHRDSFFRKLGQLGRGDTIVVETPDSRFTYLVSDTMIVAPNDVSVLDAIPGQHLLTLITCYPFRYVGAAPDRYIVQALLTSSDPTP
jgi:sortase A